MNINKNYLNHLLKIQEKIIKVSGWFTTVTLASLAFYYSLLIQLKNGAAIPYSGHSMFVVSTFSAALLMGLYNKARYEYSVWVGEVNDTAFHMRDKLIHLLEEFDCDKNKKIDNIIKKLESEILEAEESKITKPQPYIIKHLVTQVVLVIFGLLSLTSYLIRYLYY